MGTVIVIVTKQLVAERIIKHNKIKTSLKSRPQTLVGLQFSAAKVPSLFIIEKHTTYKIWLIGFGDYTDLLWWE